MITCIVQARMGSTRLKGKVLKTILDTPMILLTLKRLQRARLIDKLILATTNEVEDEPLVHIVKEAGFEVFRGDENNVLKRYVDCASQYGGETIIRITGDCPLIDAAIVDYIVSYYKLHCYDYVRLDVPNSFARGFDVEIFSKEALTKNYELAWEDKYKEHVTLYMYNHPQYFNIGILKGEGLYNKNYRLCVDTPEDFALVERIFKEFQDIYVSAKDVVAFLSSNPDIAAINQGIIQKTF